MSRRRYRRLAQSNHMNPVVRRDQAYRLITLTCRLLLVVIVSLLLKILWFPSSNNTSSSSVLSKKHPPATTAMIQYALVEKGTTGGGYKFQRYVAFLSNDKGRTRPMSIHEWAELLAENKSLSDSFIKVLKVRACVSEGQVVAVKQNVLIFISNNPALSFIAGDSLLGHVLGNQGSYISECSNK